MADYIKPFIYDHRSKNDGFKNDKLEQKEEEKPLIRSGMGDFDYDSYPLLAMIEDLPDKDLLDHISDKTKKLLIDIDNEIAFNIEERKHLDDKLTSIEKEMKKRKYLYDMCLAICKEESVEIEKYSKKNKKIDSTIHYLHQTIDSWQCLIDEFRKIPDDCE